MMSYTVWRQGKPEDFDFRKMCELTRELGMDGVDVVTLSGRSAKEIRGLLDGHGLKAVCYTFFADMSMDEAAVRQKGVDAVKQGVDTALELGAPVTMIPTPGKAGVPGDVTRRNYIRGLQEAIGFARQAGVALTVENFPGAASPFVISSHVLEAVREVPGLKITLDNGNVSTGGELPGVSFARCAEHVVHAHFKDWDLAVPGEGMEGLDGRWYKAALIGEGVVDQKGTLAAMKKTGYKGSINIEYEGNRYPADAAIRKAAEHLRGLMAGLA
jgi:sugar phosphate isomerase/epimerase